MSLADLQEEVFEEVKELLATVASPQPVAALGDAYQEIEDCFQALACCHLLRGKNRTKFQNNLEWAALARRHFLVRCQAEKNLDDFHRARSRSEAVFCALAAGDVPLAVELGDRSPAVLMRDGEYEDDFAYHLVIHELVKGADAATLGSALERYEQALDGGPSTRLAVCRAIAASEAAAFEESFLALVAAQNATAKEQRPKNLDRPTFEPRSRVFVEGLALLRLAELRGMEPAQRDYPPLCPSLARLPMPSKRPDDIFLQL